MNPDHLLTSHTSQLRSIIFKKYLDLITTRTVNMNSAPLRTLTFHNEKHTETCKMANGSKYDFTRGIWVRWRDFHWFRRFYAQIHNESKPLEVVTTRNLCDANPVLGVDQARLLASQFYQKWVFDGEWGWAWSGGGCRKVLALKSTTVWPAPRKSRKYEFL